MFSRALRIALVFCAVGITFSGVSGHREAQISRLDQPMKFAAMEAQWEDSASPAPWSLVAVINQEEKRNDFNLEIPLVGSILADNNLTTSYRGLNTINEEYQQLYGPGNYIPPVAPVYWSFRAMVGIGSVLGLVAFGGLFLWWRQRDRLDTNRWFLRAALLCLPLPWLANFLGWIVTEMGRQPWIVQGLMRVEAGVSSNSFAEVLAGLIGLWTVYLGLIGLDIYLLRSTVRAGLHTPEAEIGSAPAPDYSKAGLGDGPGQHRESSEG